ncbi:MAG: hypothetical protein HC898_00010 [Phycisphaerales bacterium]|nr:hypothetical protein [Phycisphaerales bacterium]
MPPFLPMMETLEPRCLLEGGAGGMDMVAQDLNALSPAVVAHVFYNNSRLDGFDSQTNAFDDAAIATDKQALRPGQTATFANYSSYHRGINGLMFDLEGVADIPSKNAFLFKVGNTNNPATGRCTPVMLPSAYAKVRERMDVIA